MISLSTIERGDRKYFIPSLTMTEKNDFPTTWIYGKIQACYRLVTLWNSVQEEMEAPPLPLASFYISRPANEPQT